MNGIRNNLLFLFLALILATPFGASGQIFQLPDCNLFPQNSFCQGQCQFNPALPWCAPPPVVRDPVLLLPGLAGSHNRECILKDHCATSVGEWDFTPTVDWYDALIERLEAEGYEKDKDLFVVFYDWRQSNIESAVEYLVPAINKALNMSGADKVDIVAHSMGGLVARAYVQSGPQYRNDVDQLIMLGTPNEGASDSYVVWESGRLPLRWNYLGRQWLNRIERSIKKTREKEELKRPSTYRMFFPSLAELIPINPFVKRAGTTLATSQLKQGENLFLKALHDTKDRLANIDVLTVAGTGFDTLATVPITHDRTVEDLQLDRWRDGHGNPDPPQTDSTTGDETVLVSSAQAVGVAAAPLSAQHDELPGKSQDLVIAALVENPVGDFIPVHLATSGLGIDVLSPVLPIVHGPNGEILSANQNTFQNADFDWDPADLNGIKMLTISDPPPGEYDIELTGTGTGPFDLVLSYADENETTQSEFSGQAKINSKHTYSLELENDTSSLIDDTDYKALLHEIERRANEAKKNKLLKGHEGSSITRPVTHAESDLKNYEKRLAQKRDASAKDSLKDYYRELSELEQGLKEIGKVSSRQQFVSELLSMLAHIRKYSPQL
ncbi:MAG: hypothetical protein HYR90_01870 [Candidatus Andersenbacteria bacterium]|nr:hypothetical protein [Candidatus Andersenbacteria bacterium]MBI3250908.1 hypothetical protein [Candidatus Andersenbacteria bacterium]